MTDIHVVDPGSAGRFEFVERYSGHGDWKILLPAHRSQEFLSLHALHAMLAAVHRFTEPVQLVVFGGDIIDNAQTNELERFLSLVGGKWPALPPYEGVASWRWGDDAYWHPDTVDDAYKREWGFPSYGGILEEATRTWSTDGCMLPWLAAPGNHDSLVLGTAVPNGRYDELVMGDRKPCSPPSWFDLNPHRHVERFLREPQGFLAGESRAITAEPGRRTLPPGAFAAACAAAQGSPPGHGFGVDGRRCFAWDAVDDVRLIFLDTTNPAGHYDGSLDRPQLQWLEDRLIEVHSRYLQRDGRTVRAGASDRTVVIVSHHGRATLTNLRTAFEGDEPRCGGREVEEVLHRFPNVVLWLSGHTHRNEIQARPDPTGRTAGFWEITTASVMDWPCQSRLVEIVETRDGELSIQCTMLNGAAPPDPKAATGVERLAAIHRELAANDPHAGLRSGKAGRPEDRTVDLRIASAVPARI